jgi:hypothetical protein
LNCIIIIIIITAALTRHFENEPEERHETGHVNNFRNAKYRFFKMWYAFVLYCNIIEEKIASA